MVAVTVAGVIQAHTSTRPGRNLARGRDLTPGEQVLDHLYGPGGPDDGLYRINVLADGSYESHSAITAAEVANGDVIFTNGMRNGFGAAVRNGTRHLNQAGLLKQSYVLNFNSTQGFFRDLLEASRDVIGAHTGWVHSSLARDLAAVLDGLAARGITGIRLVGHSQGGAITASAVRHALSAGLDLSALSGGAVALHGAPVNAWLANNRLAARAGVGITSRAQFGDAVHVLGGLNISNPVELPVALFRLPALFSPDPGLSPHTLPCGGGRRSVCAF